MQSKNVHALFLPLAICLALCLADKVKASNSELQTAKTQAMTAAGSGNYEAAVELYNKAISLAREQYGERAYCLSDLYLNLGTVAQESGKFQMAEDAYNAAIATNPNSISARLQMADLLKIRDRPMERKQQILKALALNENSVSTRKKLALFYQTQGNQYKAIEEFVKAGKAAEFSRITVHPSAGGVSRVHATPEPFEPKTTKPVTNSSAALKNLTMPAGIKQPAQAKVEPPKPVAPVQVKKAPKPVVKKVRKVERPQPKPSKPRLTKQSPKSDDVMSGSLAEPKELKAVPLRVKAGSLKPKKGMSRGLIPPPPPVVPAYPGMAPPPPVQPAAQPETKASKPKPKKARTEAQEDHGSSGGASDDFLLDWADKKK